MIIKYFSKNQTLDLKNINFNDTQVHINTPLITRITYVNTPEIKTKCIRNEADVPQA